MRPRATLWLRLSESGERTQVRLRCTVPAQLPTAILHQWLAQLSYWSGGPVHVVLSADGPCWWQEPWTDALAEAPGHLLRVHFRMRGEGGRGE